MKRLKKKGTVLLIGLWLVLLTTGCGLQRQKRYEASFLELFDTISIVVGYTQSEEEFMSYSQLIYDCLEEYNALFDIYNEYDGMNNLKTINDNAGIAPVKVDRKIIDLLLFSREMHDKTDGTINIAFGSVLSLWHDYREEGFNDPDRASLPEMNELRKRNEHVDISRMIIDEQASTVYLEDADMRLDVGAIAKGYAVEQVAQAAEQAGFVNGMISVGGNVRTIGHKYDEYGREALWNVGVQNPDASSENANLYILSMSDKSLVTSGVYQRYYVVDEKQYHHIIHPDTLMPTEYYLSVSIVCRDSGLADALSTAVFNLPYEEGLELLGNWESVEALWVFPDGSMEYTPGFEKLVKR